MAATDWTPFELLAEGWERFTAERITADPDYRSGIALCAKQLRETIASAKQDEEN
jgi:hypothetical protein